MKWIPFYLDMNDAWGQIDTYEDWLAFVMRVAAIRKQPFAATYDAILRRCYIVSGSGQRWTAGTRIEHFRGIPIRAWFDNNNLPWLAVEEHVAELLLELAAVRGERAGAINESWVPRASGQSIEWVNGPMEVWFDFEDDNRAAWFYNLSTTGISGPMPSPREAMRAAEATWGAKCATE